MKLDLGKINLTPKTLDEATTVIGQLVKIIIELKKEIDSLKEQLNNNSKNSSLPPSLDFKKKKKMKPQSERLIGRGDHAKVCANLRKVGQVPARLTSGQAPAR